MKPSRQPRPTIAQVANRKNPPTTPALERPMLPQTRLRADEGRTPNLVIAERRWLKLRTQSDR